MFGNRGWGHGSVGKVVLCDPHIHCDSPIPELAQTYVQLLIDLKMLGNSNNKAGVFFADKFPSCKLLSLDTCALTCIYTHTHRE